MLELVDAIKTHIASGSFYSDFLTLTLGPNFHDVPVGELQKKFVAAVNEHSST